MPYKLRGKVRTLKVATLINYMYFANLLTSMFLFYQGKKLLEDAQQSEA